MRLSPFCSRLSCTALVMCVALLSGWIGPARVSAQAGGKVELKQLDWDGLQKLIASKKGKIIVLDAWSTSCVPCKKEFPNLVALHQRLGKQVACISVSCDYTGAKSKPPKFYEERVLKFLETQKATFDNVLATVPSDEMFEKLEIPAIPAVFVYGRDGKLVKLFDNSNAKTEAEEFTYADVNKLVDKLLADSK